MCFFRVLLLLALLWSCEAVEKEEVGFNTILKVWKKNPDLQSLEVRDDYVALRKACRAVPGDRAFQMFIGAFLHGFYYPEAVNHVVKSMELFDMRASSGTARNKAVSTALKK